MNIPEKTKPAQGGLHGVLGYIQTAGNLLEVTQSLCKKQIRSYDRLLNIAINPCFINHTLD